MKKNGNNNDKEKKKNEDNDKQQGITFVNCPIHNIQYPKGSTCPVCESDKKKK